MLVFTPSKEYLFVIECIVGYISFYSPEYLFSLGTSKRHNVNNVDNVDNVYNFFTAQGNSANITVFYYIKLLRGWNNVDNVN